MFPMVSCSVRVLFVVMLGLLEMFVFEIKKALSARALSDE